MATGLTLGPNNHVMAGTNDLGGLPGVLRYQANKNLFQLTADNAQAADREKIGYYAGGGQMPIAVDVAPEQYTKFITSSKDGEWGIMSRWAQYDNAKTFLEAALTADLAPASGDQPDAAIEKARAKTSVQNELAAMRKFRLFGGGSKGKVLCFLARIVGDGHLPPANARKVLEILAKEQNRKNYRDLVGNNNSDYPPLIAALRNMQTAELNELINSNNDGSKGVALLQGVLHTIISARQKTAASSTTQQQKNTPPPPRLPHNQGTPSPTPTPPAKPAITTPPQRPSTTVQPQHTQPTAVPRPAAVVQQPPPPPPITIDEFRARFIGICEPLMRGAEGAPPPDPHTREGRIRSGYEIMRRALLTPPLPALPTAPEMLARMRQDLVLFWAHVVTSTTPEQQYVGKLVQLFGSRVAQPHPPWFDFVYRNRLQIHNDYHYSPEDITVLGQMYQQQLASIPGHIPTLFQPVINIPQQDRLDDLSYVLRIRDSLHEYITPGALQEAERQATPGQPYQLAFPIVHHRHWIGVLLNVTPGTRPEQKRYQFTIFNSTIHNSSQARERSGWEQHFVLPMFAIALGIPAPATVRLPTPQPQLLNPVQPPRYQQPEGTDSLCGPCTLANLFNAGLPPDERARGHEQGHDGNNLRYTQIAMASRHPNTAFASRFLQQQDEVQANPQRGIAGREGLPDAMEVAVQILDFQIPERFSPFAALELLERHQLDHPLQLPPPPPPSVVIPPPTQPIPQAPLDVHPPTATPPQPLPGTTSVPPGQDPLSSQGSGNS